MSSLDAAVRDRLDAWQTANGTERLWRGDATLWTGSGEDRWLGWLGLADPSPSRDDELRALGAFSREHAFSDAVVLGMGGSSLCPDVLRKTFGRVEGFPELSVLDSTDPSQVRTLESRLDLERTLFIVASKSGSTLEPNVFMKYFLERAGSAERFIAITDPGSSLERFARDAGFARVVHGVPSVGGRFSALSAFGMVPAAVMGLDGVGLLARARRMAEATRASSPDNPGVRLGVTLGVAAERGRDKLTLVVSPSLSSLGAWLEQLVAESTGKQGKAVIPIDGETVGPPAVYGDDRLFVYIRHDAARAPVLAHDEAVAALEAAGHPVVRIEVDALEDIGAELFRWEIATAVAGAVLGINPFDQPDVEASKVATRALTEAYESTGRLPEESDVLEAASPRLEEAVKELLGSLTGGDYFALLAYIEMSPAHESLLQSLRNTVRDRTRAATCLGFGPRFLHSTGQAYKGGPNTGVFLQITCDDPEDLPVPGHRYTFGVVKAAQARGDLQVLKERGRRALRVHLGADVASGLERLERAVTSALGGP